MADTPDIERRDFTVEGFAVETRDDGKKVWRGHAAVFNKLSSDLGGFREKIEPGAFAEAIAKDDVRALFNHDPNIILGRNRSGTLRMVEDAKGLAIEIDPPDTQAARDLEISMKRGDVTQMSFAFSVRTKEGQEWLDDGKSITRTLKNLRLYDVSPVVYPAYPQTDIAVREMRSWQAAQTPPAAGPSRLARAKTKQSEIA